MERKLSVERLYNLGNFSNLRFVDEITQIPEEVALNQKAISLIYQLQILEIEKSFTKYALLTKTLPAKPEQMEKTMEILEDIKSRVFQEFIEELNKKETK